VPGGGTGGRSRPSPCDTACSARSRSHPALPSSSPIAAPFLLCKLTRSKGPSLHRHYPASSVPLTLSDAQMVRNPFRSRSQVATLPPPRASPTDRRLPYLACCAHYPGGPIRANGYRFSALPRRVLPDGLGLPRSSAGSASTLDLSRPAPASLALRPAKLLAHLSVDFVARFRSGQFPNRTARQLSNLTINYSSGSFPHW